MSADQNENATLGRAVRFDLIIAVCALLVSTLATAASWWQTRVIAQQLSAQVWPYVTFTQTNSPDALEIGLSNDGLGPAVIKSFVVRIDGKAQQDFLSVLHALAIPRGPEGTGAQRRTIRTSVIEPGQVLRPSSATDIIAVTNGSRTVPLLVRQAARVTIELCYCSILAACWEVAYPNGEPKALAACPDRSAEQLHDIAPADILRAAR